MLLLTHTFSNASEAINALFMSLISLLWLPCIKKTSSQKLKGALII